MILPISRRAAGANASDAKAVDAGADQDLERYRLVSIDAVHAPEGCTGRDWHVYRIVQGVNEITGYRQGDLERVNADVEEIIAALNGRRAWGSHKARVR
jgi:hypothetical protein